VSVDVQKATRRLVAMILLNTACLVAAGVFAFGYFGRAVGWMLWAFLLSLVAGFAVQLWFIYGLGRTNKGA
jgi:hypothetical protein